MIIDNYQRQLVNEYFSQAVDCKMYLADHWTKGLSRPKNEVIATDMNLFSRVVYRLAGRKYIRTEAAIKNSTIYLATVDTIKYLLDHNVRVIFVQRIAHKPGFEYSESARKRMAEAAGFPKMSENYAAYEADFKELIGEKATAEYIEQIKKVPQIVYKGDKYVHEDCKSELINVLAGKRLVPGAPHEAEHSMYVYGRCGVFGYAVEDNETIPAILQKHINEENMSIKVVNCGLWGGDDNCILHNFIGDSNNIKSGDTVVFYLKHFDNGIMDILKKAGMEYYDVSMQWHDFEEAKWCFYDRPGHMNKDGYRNTAGMIWDKFKNRPDYKTEPAKDYAVRNYYLKTMQNTAFDKEMADYIQMVKEKANISELPKHCGGIVMNCNPFTYGHRQLVEYASRQVDKLFIFVVEENKSYFTFEDRFEMVQKGVADLENVIVVPSGKFIISALTFPEYFMKDYVKEKEFDISKDLTIFASQIAPALNIRVRFAGQEPFDPVTERYNEEMKAILPEYGLEFCEIPRFSNAKEEVISATKVRELIKAKDETELAVFVPETTLEVVKRKYM